ncbi:MAG: hypothetical protein QXI39_00300 [Candidatus Bathyarchaeia archaeon]
MSLEIRCLQKEKLMHKVIELADSVLKSRKSIYQDNWLLMDLNALLCGAYYKINRAMFTRDEAKKLDDLLDSLNYLRFVIARLLDENERREMEKC